MKQLSKMSVLVFLFLFLMNTVAGHKVIAEDQEGFLMVTGPCNLTFPKDHGSHPGYRTEWWYYTGNLISDSGDRYGYQLTFFRSQISPPGAIKSWPQPSSAWRTQHIIVGHAAISNISDKRHLQAELISREALEMAGVTQNSAETTVFIQNWSAKIGVDNHILSADGTDFSINLTLKPAKRPVLHGQAGYHRKGRAKERATCYYSLTRLISNGTLKIDGKPIAVEGLSWMDHEYGTAFLNTDTVGWDWFSLQLSNETEVILYIGREKSGDVNPASGGIFVDRLGIPQYFTRDDFSIRVLEQWKSPNSGGNYPVAWDINILPFGIDLTIIANLYNQEMLTVATTGIIYWEGSVSASGTFAEQPVKAEGYAELTGYAKAFQAPM